MTSDDMQRSGAGNTDASEHLLIQSSSAIELGRDDSRRMMVRTADGGYDNGSNITGEDSTLPNPISISASAVQFQAGSSMDS